MNCFHARLKTQVAWQELTCTVIGEYLWIVR